LDGGGGGDFYKVPVAEHETAPLLSLGCLSLGSDSAPTVWHSDLALEQIDAGLKEFELGRTGVASFGRDSSECSPLSGMLKKNK
jgi:hypothetical protein